MLFIQCPARLCRNLSCLPVSKLFTTAHLAGAARPAANMISGREEPILTVGKNYQGQTITINLPHPSSPDTLPLVPSNEQTNSIPNKITKKTNDAAKEPEWRPIEVDKSKLYKHCLMLSKIRLTSLVVITTMGGYALAPAPFDIQTFLLVSVGTGMVSATANSINQFFEVPFDAQMSRTKNRVLVRNHLTPAHAIAFAAVSGAAGLSTLYFGVNGVTAALGATNLVLYTLIYTPMKRVSILNTWVGSVVGAIPPLMGWAGCTGDISAAGAWIMSGMLYAWQFPHFNALSWNLRPDYSRAGYRMMAVTNPGLCRRTALRYTAALMGLSYLAPVLDVTNWWFAVESTPLNAYFLYLAWQFNRNSDSATSRKLFRFSLIHLPALMLLLLLNKKYWSNKKEVSDIKTSNDIQKDGFLSIFTKPTALAASTT